MKIEDLAWNACWFLLVRPVEALKNIRAKRNRYRIWREVRRKGVLDGAFKGMLYAEECAVGSALYPKLLGTYEREISQTILDLSENSYDGIFDIGCAEGYYAVGLSLLFPSTPVYAYDTNDFARELCRNMSVLNEVDESVTLFGHCEPFELAETVSGKRNFVMCDCEGFEDDLFDRIYVDSFARSDLIVETHDFLVAGVTEKISLLFESTHDISIISATSDDFKACNYETNPLIECDYWMRRELLREGRPPGMNWLVMFSKSPAD